MAKRVRGSSSRPGQRARLQRGATRSATPRTAGPASTTPVAPRPATLTPEEAARAAELEAEIVAQEQAAAATATRRTRERVRRATDVDPAVRGGSIAVRASQEYAYVARDVRRIAVIGGSLIGLLLGLWVVVSVTGIGPI